MSVKQTLFKYFQSLYILLPKVIPGYLGKRFRAESAEKLVVIDEINTKYGLLKYYCMGWLPLWRSKTLFLKEPETIDWIDSMKQSDILWDIGSNVGLYSIYAGLKGIKVNAFEPSALNTFLISKNIEINNLKDNVFLFPIALSNKNDFGFLNMTSTDLGGALNEFSETDLNFVNISDQKKNVVFSQGIFSFKIDDLVNQYNFKIPNYIKIDVDNIEDKIIYGGSSTLAKKDVKGLLIELDETEKRTKKLIDFLFHLGLILKDKRQSEMIKSGNFKSTYNYIFERL